MRIAVVSETFPPEINGVALTVRNFVVGAAALGHRLQVVRPRQPDPEGAAEGPWETLVVPGAPLPRYRGLRFGFPMSGRIRKAWQSFKPDAVYVATEGPLGWAALRAARRLGIPVASGFHTRFDDFVSHYGFNWLRRPAFAYLRAFHNRTHRTLVPTTRLRQFLLDAGFSGVEVLDRGVDTQRFDPARRDRDLRAQWGADDDTLVVLHVGRLAPEKNLGLVERSFAEIQATVPGARLVWVGDGPDRAGLQGRHSEQHFAGMRTGLDLARHYASGDLFLFPSLTETFGNVTLEALASGVPVVAFDYGAAGRHLADGAGGRAVPFGDESAFIEAAVALARDESLRRRAGQRGHALMQAHSLAGVASRFVAQLQQLGDRPSASPRSLPA